MSVDLSDAASNVMLDALSALMDGGSIQLMSDSTLLAILKLSDPAATIVGRGLEFNDIADEDAALAQGNAIIARIVGSNGSEILSCDVGDENSDAEIKFRGTTKIYRGQPVRLKSFRLVMP